MFSCYTIFLVFLMFVFFFNHDTAYELRISDWSSDVCSSDLTFWRLYSMTKPVTGMAAMLLIEEVRMALDQPIADFLPAFANMTVQNTPDGSITDVRPAKGPITVRQLLTHSAGLGYNIIQKGPIRDAYNAAGFLGGQVSRLPIPGFPPSSSAPCLAVFSDRLAHLTLVYEPGTRWSYSVGLDQVGRAACRERDGQYGLNPVVAVF